MITMITTDTEYAQLRIKTTTRDKLRLLYALTGERMIDIVARLISEELERIEKGNVSNVQVQTP